MNTFHQYFLSLSISPCYRIFYIQQGPPPVPIYPSAIPLSPRPPPSFASPCTSSPPSASHVPLLTDCCTAQLSHLSSPTNQPTHPSPPFNLNSPFSHCTHNFFPPTQPFRNSQNFSHTHKSLKILLHTQKPTHRKTNCASGPWEFSKV